MLNPQKTNLAICIYGLEENRELVDKIKYENNIIFPTCRTTYFENVGDPDLYKNLWLASSKKRQNELINSSEYNICIAYNISDKFVSEYLFSPTNPTYSLIITSSTFEDTSSDKLYYVKGGYRPTRAFTEVSPSIFFSSSLIFDLASNFSVARPSFSIEINRGQDDEDFYYFLKTIRIKTECINYENRKLFNPSIGQDLL